MSTLLLATRNPGKKNEIESLLREIQLPIKLLTLADVDVRADVNESGTTFAENAC